MAVIIKVEWLGACDTILMQGEKEKNKKKKNNDLQCTRKCQRGCVTQQGLTCTSQGLVLLFPV